MTVRALDPTNLPVVYAQIAAGEGMLVGGAGLEHVVSKSLLWPSYDQVRSRHGLFAFCFSINVPARCYSGTFSWQSTHFRQLMKSFLC